MYVYNNVCMSTFSNIFSETTGPIEAKFHMEPPWNRGTKVCSNGPGHMTKMAVMPVYGKNLKKIFFSETHLRKKASFSAASAQLRSCRKAS